MATDTVLIEKETRPGAAAVEVGRIECHVEVDPAEWDRLAEDLGGSFFHCHAYTLYEAALPNTRPLFVKAFDPQGACIAVATAALGTPRRWPFARSCKEARFDALPATRDGSPETVQAVLAAIERELRRLGVFRIHVQSYSSPHSARVLAALNYELSERTEFHIDLDRPIEAVWEGLRRERRQKIRKATKVGVRTVEENTVAGLELLWRLHAEALQRRGIEVSASDEHLELMKRLLLDGGRCKNLVSYEGDVPVGALLFGVFGREASSLLSGSSPAGNRCAAPAHANWAMMELASAAGAKTLNIGGVTSGDGESDGLAAFKRDFGATPLTQPAGTKILSRWGLLLDSVRCWLKRPRRRPATATTSPQPEAAAP